ncbi:tetratricopeptide repeat protein [Hyalangium rubrum]|uniref:Tetratricopeptide repeat protein n=1 Tax=Hyalangium rubrum TaxID=3103134 RepID=A0ABU5HIM3_9BACT|nr:tetratricopeptide repeat protein [Hyalangium sp. s54d21]MDY7233312.1 tetratricopeptide repeat protein [Hyalangium sp. s54d21]
MAAVQARTNNYEARLAEGRTLMAANQPGAAAKAFRAAANVAPENLEPLLLLAEAYRAAGDEGPAILALKEAEAIAPGSDPAIQKQMADLYRRQGHIEQAITVLVGLRDGDHLTDPELLALARLQARTGDPDGAFKSLEPIQRERPDDPDAKVVEAEILLIKGEELLAAKLMDRLVDENPGLIEARLLRVRYFFNSGYAAEALQDLSGITGKDAARPEVVLLRARLLTKLERHEEADAELTRLTEEHPDNAEGLAQLAETKLLLNKPAEAQQLVDKVLRMRARYPRALYVRARAMELQGDKQGAEEHYGYALMADPRFAPALSRMWRLYRERGEKGEAMAALEKLYFSGEASVEEKVSLAELYAESKTNLERGRKLIDEALQREPGNPKYVAIKASLTQAAPKKKPQGIQIMRGRR